MRGRKRSPERNIPDAGKAGRPEIRPFWRFGGGRSRHEGYRADAARDGNSLNMRTDRRDPAQVVP
jgi:hypothetical protein